MTDDDKKERANPPQSPQGDASADTPVIPVRSLEEYIKVTQEFHSLWKNALWFRGDSDANHRLVPSIFRLLGNNPLLASQEERKKCRDEEFQSHYRFMLRAMAIDARFPDDSDRMGQLVVMRHHGLHSRLLDWTESSLTALLFAVTKNVIKDAKDSCVWMINPHILNSKSSLDIFFGKKLKKGVLTATSPALQKMAECPFNPDLEESGDILPFAPRYSATRHMVQKSMFTMHCSLRPLDSADSGDFLRKIIIPQGRHQSIYVELEQAGITWDLLFPDLDGVAKFVNIETEIRINKAKRERQAQKQPPPVPGGGD